MMGNGRIIPLKDGNWRQEPDFKKALELLRRFVKEFQKGESRYYEQAQQQIKNITEPQVTVSVGNIFLPESEIQYNLNWRNVKRVSLALYAVDLTHDVKLSGTKNTYEWLSTIEVAGSRENQVLDSRHQRQRRLRARRRRTLPDQNRNSPAGAYLLEGRRAGERSAREIVACQCRTPALS